MRLFAFTGRDGELSQAINSLSVIIVFKSIHLREALKWFSSHVMHTTRTAHLLWQHVMAGPRILALPRLA